MFEPENAPRSDDGAWAAIPQTDAFTPPLSVAEARRSDIIHALDQAALVVRHDHDKPSGQAGNVRCAPAPGQLRLRRFGVSQVRCIQVAEAVKFRAADKSEIHRSPLE